MYALTTNQEENKVKPLFLRLSLLTFILFFMAACMPLNDENINTELFKDTEDMKARTAQLERGMHKNNVFKELGVPREKFATMDTEQLQKAIYGNSQVQGTPEQLEKFRVRLQSYEGYALPYRQIESKGSLGFGKMKVNKTGHDLMLILIFENDKLTKATVVGNEELNLKEDQYLWNSLIKGGVGRVF